MRKINRTLSKFLLSLLFVMLFVSIFSVSIVSADTVKTDDGSYNYTTTRETVRELTKGCNFIYNLGYTTRSKVNYDQRVSLFSCDISENSDIKVATWAILDPSHTGFIRRGLLEVAKDYERHNPGWIVLAGINADQYFPTFGTGIGSNGSYMYIPSPYYPMVSNGDNWFTISALGYATMSNVVGFKNDGSKDPLVNGPRTANGFMLYVYDENDNVIDKLPVDGLNCDLGSNKTVVFATYNDAKDSYKSITRTANSDETIYYVSTSELSYVSNTTAWRSWNDRAQDAFFGKGVIASTPDSVTLNRGACFAIVTSNADVKAKLGVGVKIKVQLEFDDGFAGIEEAMGYHTVQRRGGKDQNVANSYNSRAYPRSMFGCDANGKVYLMTCFGDNSSPLQGLYAQEFNAVCKKYGITDAWQMDGGGSVTSIVRDVNGTGELKYNEACIEASHNKKVDTYEEYRYILSGLFIVMKSPELDLEVTEKSDSSVNLSLNTANLRTAKGEKYDSVTLKVLDKNSKVYKDFEVDLEKEVNTFNIKGMISFNDYYCELSYTKNGYEQQGYKYFNFYTDKAKPKIDVLEAVKVGNGYEIKISLIDTDDSIEKMYAVYNDKKYEMALHDGIASCTITDNIDINKLTYQAECIFKVAKQEKETVDLEVRYFKYPVSDFFSQAMNKINDMIERFSR